MPTPSGTNTDSFQQALRYAIARLASRDHGCNELAAKLARKGFDRPAISQVIATCKDRGYLDDRRYAADFAAIRQRKGFGPAWIKAALKSKGIDSTIIEQTLNRHCSHRAQIEAARIAFNRKLRSLNARPQQNRRQKLWNYLYRRGFSTAVISELIDRLGPAEL